jgi:hypothetical protein
VLQAVSAKLIHAANLMLALGPNPRHGYNEDSYSIISKYMSCRKIVCVNNRLQFRLVKLVTSLYGMIMWQN